MLQDNHSINAAGHLAVAGVDTVALAEQYGTPLYVMDEARLRENMRRYDRNRSEFYRSVTDHNWDDREAYGLMLNTSYLSLEACVDLIDATAQFKRTQN